MGTMASGTYEVVCYKGGEAWDRSNFPAFFNSITSVRAEVGGGGTSKITITLNPSLIDGVRILQSGILGASTADPSQVPKTGGTTTVTPSSTAAPAAATSADKPATAPSNATYYACRFLYPGEGDEGATPWYGGFTCVPKFTIAGSVFEITVTVTGTHTLMSILGGPVVINNESALDVIKRFASKFGVSITFDKEDKQTEKILSDAKISGAFNEDYDDIIRRILTDLRCSYVKYDGDDAAPAAQYRIKSTQYMSKQPIEYHLVSMRQISPGENVIPCEEVSLESLGALFAPGHQFGTYQRELITGEKRVNLYARSTDDFEGDSDSASKADGGSVPEDSGDGEEKGGATGVVDDGGDVVAGHVSSDVQRDENLTSADRLASVSEMGRNGAMLFTVTCPGIPRIRPLSYVQLTIGPGDNGIEAFSGPCGVQKLEHSVDEGGWRTVIHLNKTGGPTYNASATPKESEAPKTPKGGTSPTITDF